MVGEQISCLKVLAFSLVEMMSILLRSLSTGQVNATRCRKSGLFLLERTGITAESL